MTEKPVPVPICRRVDFAPWEHVPLAPMAVTSWSALTPSLERPPNGLWSSTDLDGYEAVALGSAVDLGHWLGAARDFVELFSVAAPRPVSAELASADQPCCKAAINHQRFSGDER